MLGNVNDPQRAIAEADVVLARLRNATDPALQEHLYVAWWRKAEALEAMERNEDAVAVYDELLDHADKKQPALSLWLVKALTRRGFALRQLGRFEDELEAYDEVARRFGDTTLADVREWVAKAAFYRTVTYGNLNSTFAKVDMVRECEGLVERFSKDSLPQTRLMVARAMLWQGILLSDLNYHEQAIQIYSQVIERYLSAPEPEVRLRALMAHTNMGIAYEKLGRGRDAIAIVDRALTLFRDDRDPAIRAMRAEAACNQASSFEAEGNIDAALNVLGAVVAEYADEAGPVRAQVCRAMRHQAGFLRELGRNDEAAPIYARIVENYGQDAQPEVRERVAMALINRIAMAVSTPEELPLCEAAIAMIEGWGDHAADDMLVRAYLMKGRAQLRLTQSEAALATLEFLIKYFDHHLDDGIVLRVARARLEKAFALGDLGRKAEKRAVYSELIALIDDTSDDAELREVGADARYRLSYELGDDIAERAKVVDELLQRFGGDKEAEVRCHAAKAAYGLASCMDRLKDYEGAVARADQMMQQFGEDFDPAIRRTVASILLNKGAWLLDELDRPEQALATYDDLLRRFANPGDDKDLQKTLAKAMGNRNLCLNRMATDGKMGDWGGFPDLSVEERDAVRGLVGDGRRLANQGEIRKGIAKFDEVISGYGEAIHPELRHQCARAWFNKGHYLLDLGQYEAAIEALEEVDRRYGIELSTTLQEVVALALSNKATALDKLERHDEELAVYAEIIRRYGGSTVFELRRRTANAMLNRGIALMEMGRADEAMTAYEELIESTMDAPESNMQLFAAKAMLGQTSHLGKLGRHADRLPIYHRMIDRFGGTDDPQLCEWVISAYEYQAVSQALLGDKAAASAGTRLALEKFGAQMPEEQRRRMETRLNDWTPPKVGGLRGWLGSMLKNKSRSE